MISILPSLLAAGRWLVATRTRRLVVAGLLLFAAGAAWYRSRRPPTAVTTSTTTIRAATTTAKRIIENADLTVDAEGGETIVLLDERGQVRTVRNVGGRIKVAARLSASRYETASGFTESARTEETRTPVATAREWSRFGLFGTVDTGMGWTAGPTWEAVQVKLPFLPEVAASVGVGIGQDREGGFGGVGLVNLRFR